MEEVRLRNLFLLWFGAAISIAEIVTGTLMAPLGFGRGILAIIIGHVIGCFGFLLPAGYISAHYQSTAIKVTQLTFGKQGVRLFSLLNVLQLLGWTAVMIVNAQLAMNVLTQSFFHWQSKLLMSGIVAGLIILWLLLRHDWLFKINNWVVLLLTLAMIVFVVSLLQKAPTTHAPQPSTLSFNNAVELNVTMALSWLPVIGDYTKQTRHPIQTSWCSVLGYFVGSVAMFVVGLSIARWTGRTDISQALAQSQLGLIALLIVVFSTVTTTFMDAYSAATNLQNLNAKVPVNAAAIGITIVGFFIAIGISLQYYENFLYAIGAAFTPLFAIVFVSVFVIKQRLALVWNFAWWLLGIIAYYGLQQLNLIFGPTFWLLIAESLAVYLTSKVTPHYPLSW